MRAFLLAAIVVGLASPVEAEPLKVTGKAGYLQEWELTAKVTENASARKKEFSGPVTLKHVGLCTMTGPVERSGEIRLQMIESSSRIKVTLLVPGFECNYTSGLGTGSDYEGAMDCVGAPGIPVSISVK